MIFDSPSIIQARMRAAMEGTNGGGEYVEGIELEPAMAALAPAKSMGRMLSSDEAHDLIDQFEREPRNGRGRPR
jgi:hypothetical protein